MVRTTSVGDAIHQALDGVMDPEIPACSIVDLGMVERAEVTDGSVEVDLLPTFIGCPAKDLIGQDVRSALAEVAGDREVHVRFVHDPPWTTERITERGKARLREFGIAPHWDRPSGPTAVPLMTVANVPCPYCGSADTVQESSWGPAPCRAAHYCRSCRNPFEGFKEK
jgi:ring-1,2-phenylacetyl-CoA epoxidase subunit PaaD